MKKIDSLAIFLVFLVTSHFTFAQFVQELAFSDKTHDFGTINEVDGPVEYEFIFTNTGTNNINVINVNASCGCTTPGWTREEVPPGGTGYIKAKYDPQNRPGPFSKSLTVTTNGTTERYVLYIKGIVTPRPRTIEDDFPTLMGGIRVKNRGFNLGKVLNNAPVTKEFEIYNASENPIRFLDSTQAPAYITVQVLPITLEPKTKGNIIITYDTGARNDYGFMSENIVLFTDEAESSRKSFSVYANIEEYFPPMTPEELAQAPKLTFKTHLHDFGRIKQGDVVSTIFLFTNIGKSELNIRKTKATCGCTVSKPEKSTLSPGESSKLTVTFNSSGRRGSQQKSVTIFSNDPSAPTQRITIKAFIEEK